MGDGIQKNAVSFIITRSSDRPSIGEYKAKANWYGGADASGLNVRNYLKRQIHKSTVALFGEMDQNPHDSFFGVVCNPSHQDAVFYQTTLKSLPSVFEVYNEYVDGEGNHRRFFLSEYDLAATSSVYDHGATLTGHRLYNILSQMTPDNHDSTVAVVLEQLYSRWNISLADVRAHYMHCLVPQDASLEEQSYLMVRVWEVVTPPTASTIAPAGLAPCLASGAKANIKGTWNIVDPNATTECSALVNELYNGKNKPWLNSEGVGAADSWVTAISNPWRTSLIDGAWPTKWNATQAFSIGNDQGFNQHYTVLSTQSNPNPPPGTVVTPSASDKPLVVEITGIGNLPLMMFGQGVVVSETVDAHPYWYPFTTLTRRITLGNSCATDPETHSASGDSASGIVVDQNTSDGTRAVWPESGCPMIVPNYLWAKPQAQCKPNDKQNVLATKAYTRWLKYYNVNAYIKRYPPVPNSNDIATYLANITPEKWNAAVNSPATHTVYKIPQFILDSWPPALRAKYEEQVANNNLPPLSEYYCDNSGAYYFFANGWPQEWPAPPVPSQDVIHQAGININLFMTEMGLEWDDILLIAALELPIAYLSRNIHPEVVVPISFIGMLGGYIWWNSRNMTSVEFQSALSEFETGVKDAVSGTDDAISTAKSKEPYIITAAVGLGATGLIMYATYKELGAASSELLATEAAFGLIGTGIAEIIVAAGIGWDDLKKSIGL